jgi:hypothetical protein
MQKFEFNHKGKMWDRYKAFHNTEGPFTEFETGEVIVTYLPQPRGRGRQNKYGIELVTTRDRECPTLYFDKECTQPVKRAWLLQDGQQHLAIDRERKVAIKLAPYRYRRNSPELQYLASHVDACHAIWTGPERLPIPLSKITVSQPDRTIKRTLGEKLEDVRAAVKAAARIQELPDFMWGGDKFPAHKDWQDMTVEDICAYVCADKSRMRQVAFSGFSYPRAETQHEFLYVA